MLGNALGWVDAPVPVLARELGSVEVALPGAKVHDSNGNPVAASVTEHGIVFEASRADVFTVSTSDKQILVVVNVADPRYSQINRSRLSEGNPATQREPSPQGGNTELWALLLLLAGAFLLFEWAVFTRPRAV